MTDGGSEMLDANTVDLFVLISEHCILSLYVYNIVIALKLHVV